MPPIRGSDDRRVNYTCEIGGPHVTARYAPKAEEVHTRTRQDLSGVYEDQKYKKPES
jgi:hypothetical protein